MLTESMNANYETLVDAATAGRLALVECTDKEGNVVPTLCAMNFDGEGVEMVPLASLFTGNPYEQLTPPDFD